MLLFHTPCLYLHSEHVSALLDLVIVADKSESLSRADHFKLYKLIKKLIAHLDVDSGAVRIAFVEYSDDELVRFNLQQFSTSASMIEAIDNMDMKLVPPGGTNTGILLLFLNK